MRLIDETMGGGGGVLVWTFVWGPGRRGAGMDICVGAGAEGKGLMRRVL